MERETTRVMSGGRPSVVEALRAHASVICLHNILDLVKTIVTLWIYTEAKKS